MDAICAEGSKRVERLVEQAKLCHGALIRHLLQTKNEFYSSTIVDGINGFFKLYETEFAAQEIHMLLFTRQCSAKLFSCICTKMRGLQPPNRLRFVRSCCCELLAVNSNIHITADYPVYNKAERLLGIEFIIQYLEQLHYENLFCTHFSEEVIHHLLCGYDEHYENLLLNIYEPVLAASLGCVLADIPANSLEITPENQPKLMISYGEKMNDELYRKVLALFMSSESMPEKINIMKSQIKSLADLEDLLLDWIYVNTLDIKS